jgi:hypothetical protein
MHHGHHNLEQATITIADRVAAEYGVRRCLSRSTIQGDDIAIDGIDE